MVSLTLYLLLLECRHAHNRQKCVCVADEVTKASGLWEKDHNGEVEKGTDSIQSSSRREKSSEKRPRRIVYELMSFIYTNQTLNNIPKPIRREL